MTRALPLSDAAGAPQLEAALVGAIARVQGLVARQAPPEDVYQAVVDGAIQLLGGEGGGLRIVDLDDPQWMVAVATQPPLQNSEAWRRRAPITEGVSGRAITTGELVAVDGEDLVRSRSTLTPRSIQAAVSVPIRERGRVVGALVVGTPAADRLWSDEERRLIAAYAEHVEIALTVARANHGALQAYADSLTGLGNRALLLDRLDHRLARADRRGRSVTVLFLDLDRFKIVNDSLGHMLGDQLLIAVADRLRRCVRDEDVCARLGGDEFAILLDSGADADAVAARIIDALQERFIIDGHEVFIGVSVGIAAGHDEAQALLRNADVAMYHAKRSGTGRYAHFLPVMHSALVSRLGLDAELRRAVEREELELHFQPLIDLRSGTVTGLESLVRWRHPERGLIPPVDFIPLAEETGLIVEIDRWVLTHACRRFETWWGRSPLSISVNASMRDLRCPGFAAEVESVIGNAFPPSALILEVTESARLEDAPGALATLHDLKDLGVRVALDDFGTGYSSLLSLSQLPVDQLKIARPFLPAPGHDHGKSTGLLAGMIALGRHLGLVTVAEGIETTEQRDLVVALGCDIGQGYLFGRPADAGTTTVLLAARSVADR